MRFSINLILVFYSLVVSTVMPQSLPTSGKTPQTLVPDSHEILERAEGDLNQDGHNDLVLIFREKNEDGTPRILAIYFYNPKFGYQLSDYTSDFLLKSNEGGVMGDPFGSLTIKKGVIVVQHSGGSREKWSYTHRFRFQDEKFFLIGKTESVYDSMTGESKTTDSNLLTGKTEISITNSKGKSSKKMESPGKKPLPPLVSFKIFE